MRNQICNSKLPLLASRALIFHSRSEIRLTRSIPWPPPYKNLRGLFIQTDTTPNADVRISKSLSLWRTQGLSFKALKFNPHHPVLPPGLSSSLEYLSPRSTITGPNTSPLAGRLLSIDGIASVLYGPDFITVTKAADANWSHLKPEVFSLISEAFTSGEEIVHIAQSHSSKSHSSKSHDDDIPDILADSNNDSEVVALIKELLDTRIRPAIQDDGGDIEFRGFKDGKVLLKLRGACRTCDSSTVTLRNGIETMLKHYVRFTDKGIFLYLLMNFGTDWWSQRCYSNTWSGRGNLNEGVWKVRKENEREAIIRTSTNHPRVLRT